jgi:hypothetical protein
MTDHDAIAARVRQDRMSGTMLTGPVYIKLADMADAYLDLYDEAKRLRAALDEIATAASGIAHDLQIGPDDEGRDIYEMALAIRDDARAALKGSEK